MITPLVDFSSVDILVAGDLMLDRYWRGGTQRISPEAPVPVVLINDLEERPGGAGNVARSITALGGSCSIAALLGDDESGSKLEELLDKDNVSTHCLKDSSARTVAKLRVLSRNQQLIRLDFEADFSKKCIDQLTDLIIGEIERHDVLILSDYNKGALSNIEKIINKANSMGTHIFVDPKGNNFEKYKNVTAITPNQAEFSAVVGTVETDQEIADKGLKLLKELNLTALIITRSEKGVTLIEKSGEITDIPARTKEVFDVTGAGDTFISVLAASYTVNSSFKDSVNIANAAASVVVGKLGAATVSKNEIENELYRSSQVLKKVIDQEDLIKEVTSCQKEGKKIVMTNGCFDLLHKGHIACLRDARAQGDKLILAINDDQSIKRLKGKDRPICTLNNRIAVLEELNCIDWIIPFSEDTPLQLIEKIKPDIYVKGGDYKKEELDEYAIVKSYNGEVYISPYIEGNSTTDVIQSIRNS